MESAHVDAGAHLIEPVLVRHGTEALVVTRRGASIRSPGGRQTVAEPSRLRAQLRCSGQTGRRAAVPVRTVGRLRRREALRGCAQAGLPALARRGRRPRGALALLLPPRLPQEVEAREAHVERVSRRDVPREVRLVHIVVVCDHRGEIEAGGLHERKGSARRVRDGPRRQPRLPRLRVRLEEEVALGAGDGDGGHERCCGRRPHAHLRVIRAPRRYRVWRRGIQAPVLHKVACIPQRVTLVKCDRARRGATSKAAAGERLPYAPARRTRTGVQDVPVARRAYVRPYGARREVDVHDRRRREREARHDVRLRKDGHLHKQRALNTPRSSRNRFGCRH